MTGTQVGDKPLLLYACTGVDDNQWLAAMRRELPELDIRTLADDPPLEQVGMAFIWKYPAGLLASLPRLCVAFSLGAGVESILRDPDLREDVTVVRMVDPGLAIGMNEFVLMRVLHYHRQMPEHAENQRAHRWAPCVPPLPEDRRVGILGLGELGSRCARTLVNLGFDVAGWARSPRNIDGVTTFAGREQLDAFLARTEILVCLLPLTTATANILDRRAISTLPRGAYLINVARGQHVVDEDLLAALDSGQLRGATLDVFREEPLPSTHPFWSHAKITVVPHVSAITQVKSAARTVAANIRRYLAGQPLQNVVDRKLGY
ncbi:MAG TPA: glyoxylate/hydroxypyruvate reductase A [Steroidobacteraceae bacterium]|nr:glyoxylate/hydroxypyruvate reductase A [Steroidobacteraceae bacterium]HRX89511.1 glyoxylate/hydroxypyruvate reductase A [Steroidobacteraceae bacterium]